MSKGKQKRKTSKFNILDNDLPDTGSIIEKDFLRIPPGEIPFTPEEYGRRIQKIRKEKNMTQEEVAKNLNTTKQTISNIENGNSAIELHWTKGFVHLFHCTAAYLLGYTDAPKSTEAGGNIPFEFFDEKTRVTVKGIVEGYRRDKELCELIIDLLKGTKEERAFYHRAIKAMLSYPGRSSK